MSQPEETWQSDLCIRLYSRYWTLFLHGRVTPLYISMMHGAMTTSVNLLNGKQTNSKINRQGREEWGGVVQTADSYVNKGSQHCMTSPGNSNTGEWLTVLSMQPGAKTATTVHSETFQCSVCALPKRNNEMLAVDDDKSDRVQIE